MQIFVKTINGETLTVETEVATVINVKQKLEEQEGVPVALQRLIYEGKELNDGRELVYYKVVDKSTIHLTVNLDGGGLFPPEQKRLAMYHLLFKKICCKCYGQLPPRATRCRKVKCGRTTNIRYKKTRRYDRLPENFRSFHI